MLTIKEAIQNRLIEKRQTFSCGRLVSDGWELVFGGGRYETARQARDAYLVKKEEEQKKDEEKKQNASYFWTPNGGKQTIKDKNDKIVFQCVGRGKAIDWIEARKKEGKMTVKIVENKA